MNEKSVNPKAVGSSESAQDNHGNSIRSLSESWVKMIRAHKMLWMMPGVLKTGGSTVDHSVYIVLHNIAEQEPIRQSILAQKLCIDLSVVSRHIAVIEQAGWVKRTADPTDKRAQLLSITPEGRKVIEDSWQRRLEINKEIFKDWSEADLRQLTEYFQRMSTDVQNYVQKNQKNAPKS